MTQYNRLYMFLDILFYMCQNNFLRNLLCIHLHNKFCNLKSMSPDRLHGMFLYM